MTERRPRGYEHVPTLETLSAQVHRGIDVELVGLRGSGRSTTLGHLHRRLVDDGWLVVAVRAVPGRADAVARAVERTRRGARRVPAADGTAASVLDLVGDRQAAILVDDADVLDDTEWIELRLARQERSVPVVSVHDLENLRPRRGRDLIGRSVVTATCAMPDLTILELRRLIDARYDASIDTEVLRRVFDKSGGHIGTALAIVELALADGLLAPALDGPIDAGALWQPGLEPVVDRHLAFSSPDEVAAMASLSMAGLLDVRAASEIIPLDTLSRLEARGLIRGYSSRAVPWLTMHPPLLRERFRAASRGVRAYAAWETLREGTIPVAPPASPRRRTRWLAGSDSAFSRLVVERRQSDLAAAEAEWSRERSLRTAVAMLDALNRAQAPRPRIAEVLDAAAALDRAGDRDPRRRDDPESRARLRIWRASWTAHVDDDLAGARAMLADRSRLGEYSRLLDAAAVDLTTSLERIPPDALDLLVDDPALPELVRHTLAIARAQTLLWIGRGEEAAAELGALGSSLAPDHAHRADVMRAVIDMGRGLPESANRYIERGCRRARDELDPLSLSDYLHLAVLMLFARGHQHAVGSLAENLRASQSYTHFPQTTHVALLCITAAGDLASPDLVADVEERTVSGRPPSGPLPGASLLWPRARLRHAADDAAGAADLMWEAAEDARSRGFAVAALVSALASLELVFDADRFAAVEGATRELQSPALALYLRYVRASAGGDARETSEVASGLARIGWTGRAIAAYALAARRARADGDPLLEASIRRAGEALVDEDSDDLDATSLNSPIGRLSGRERDIAEFVADGFTNQEIADRLVLSVRTVENHIHRSIRKLEVLSRTQLGIIVRARRA